MSWWKLPLTVLGLGGVGAVVWARSRRSDENRAVKQIEQWNESAQQELVRLQNHLREIASVVNPRQAT